MKLHKTNQFISLFDPFPAHDEQDEDNIVDLEINDMDVNAGDDYNRDDYDNVDNNENNVHTDEYNNDDDYHWYGKCLLWLCFWFSKYMNGMF